MPSLGSPRPLFLSYIASCRIRNIAKKSVKIFPMKVLKVRDEKRAKKLCDRLLRRGYVVAMVDREEEVKKGLVKKANIVLVVRQDNACSNGSFELQGR